MSRARPVVAIDGPAGAGKTTVTRRVAERLGYVLVGTGALYRSVALAAERQGVDWDDTAAVGVLAHDLAARGAIQFAPGRAGQQRVLLEGQDVSTAIRAEDIGQGASKVSAIPEVRRALLDMQRAAGAHGGVVLEGRDIGTVVMPDAEAKFYLTASVQVRAQRRFDELRAAGTEAALDQVMSEVIERDRRDSTRPVAPLKRAEDAELIDSSSMSIDEVVDAIVRRVEGIAKQMHTASG